MLLHGGGPGATGASNYARNIDAFASAGYRVLVPDMPGYGRSSKELDHSDPFGDLAMFVRGLLDALEVDKAHLVGNSYGGAAALRLALDRPDRVARLVLMGPGGIGTTRALPTKGLTELMNYYAGEGPSREKLRSFIRDYLVFDSSAAAGGASRAALPGEHRSGRRGEPAVAQAERARRAADAAAHGLHPRPGAPGALRRCRPW